MTFSVPHDKLILGESKMDENIIKDITIKTEAEGFSVSGKGMSESFMLNLIRTLRGEGTLEVLATPNNAPVSDLSSVLAKPYNPMFEILDPNVFTDFPKSDIGQATKIAESLPKVADTKITTIKERPTYKVNTNDGVVQSFGEVEAPSFGEKFGERAKELYAVAGVEHKEQDTEFYHTGIKYGHDDKPKFRLGYECPKCGNTGRHYVPFHITKVSCHNCQSTLRVEPATDNGIGNSEKCRDEHGNFLIALQLDMNAPVYNRD